MKKTLKTITLAAATVLTLTFAGQSFAAASTFTDLDKVAAKDKIISLQQSGLVKGITATLFAPSATITTAQGVQLIVNALGLNLDLVRFVKEPQASDYFANAKNDAWYSSALITAAVNNLELPADLDPNKNLTREEFTYQLIHAIEVSGKLPMIKPVVVDIKDGDQINVDYSGSIQRALNYKVVQLGTDGKFNPKGAITRAEAAEEIYNALEYLKAHPAPEASINETITASQGTTLIADALQLKADNPAVVTDLDPSKNLTREQFTAQLIHAIEVTGELPMIKPVVVDIKDADQINVDYSGSIQRALKYGVVKLDTDGKFNPTAEISPAEATEEINKAVEYMKDHSTKVAETITTTQGVQLVANALGLDPAKTNAANGVKLAADLDLNKKLTREEFTFVLIQNFQQSGKLPMIKPVATDIKDADQIDLLYSGSIQSAISFGVVKLSPEGTFNPKAEITLAEATEEINNALAAVTRYAQK